MASEERPDVITGMDRLYEFEREPVTKDKLQPGRYFAGLFAGEHIAGTEFTIGALWVALGVSTRDVIVGLLIGNLMAVLTWTFICAPIAVRTRLTLYWYLRRIAGPGTTAIYNVLNAVLYCILAGCMITVSASAVRILFGIPAQMGWLPSDIRFAFVALGVGAVVVALAILGFRSLAQFAEVCAPWLVVMFWAGAVVALPYIVSHTPGIEGLRSFSDFWKMAQASIWTGVDAAGKATHAFWRVAAFAWICNLAMHAGLSDMAIFRYARSRWYGLFSMFGMFIGHYFAWIFAGIMGACAMLLLKLPMSQIDPGELAFRTLGAAGIVAVILAGWTTSNPTLYRAGLAFQAVTPGWPRWFVTLIAGSVTTVVAISPKVFTGLLDFVGIYGLLLVPMGAIVVAEHWIFPRIGLTRYWAQYRKLRFSWPALATWLIVITLALLFQRDGAKPGYLANIAYGLGLESAGDFLFRISIIHLFFLFLPVYFLSILLYTVFASMAGARDKYPESQAEDAAAEEHRRAAVSTTQPREAKRPATPLLRLAQVITVGGLLVCAIWPLMVYMAGDRLGGDYMKSWETFRKYLIIPTVVYFIFGTLWAVQGERRVEKKQT
jgi:cytosine permease